MGNIKFILDKMYKFGRLYNRQVKKEYIVTKHQLDRVAEGKGLTLSEEQKMASEIMERNVDEPICRFSVIANGCRVIAECDRWTYSLVLIDGDEVQIIASGKYSNSFEEDFLAGIVCVTFIVGGNILC